MHHWTIRQLVIWMQWIRWIAKSPSAKRVSGRGKQRSFQLVLYKPSISILLLRLADVAFPRKGISPLFPTRISGRSPHFDKSLLSAAPRGNPSPGIPWIEGRAYPTNWGWCFANNKLITVNYTGCLLNVNLDLTSGCNHFEDCPTF